MRVLLTLLLTAALAPAANYYVAMNGSNANSGTSLSPFLTIQKGVDVSVAGDFVIVKDGTYDRGAGHCTTVDVNGEPDGFAVTTVANGTNGSPITIQAEHDRMVTLDSGLLCHSYFLNNKAYISIQGFIIQDNFTGGIVSQGTNCVYERNEFRNIGNFVTSTVGAKVGILTQAGSTPCTVNRNIFHHIGRTMPGSMFNWHDQNIYAAACGITITNNIIYDTISGWHIAINPAGLCSNPTVISYNTLDGPACGGCRDGQIQLGDGSGDTLTNVTIRYNISNNAQNGVVAGCAPFTYAGASPWDHNIVNSTGSPPGMPDIRSPDVCAGVTSGFGTVTQATNTSADPLFQGGPLAPDFHLLPASPAVGSALAYAPASPDFDGFARPQSGTYDAGALEYVTCSSDSRGVCVTGLSARMDKILGPVTPNLSNPWIFGDLSQTDTLNNLAVQAIADAPGLGAACPGTVSWNSGTQNITTTSNLNACLSGQTYLILAWDTIDGPGTGRHACSLGGITSTNVHCNETIAPPTQSGITVYVPEAAKADGCNFTCWAPTGNPNTSWNYYDGAIGAYRKYHRTLNKTFLLYAQKMSDINWQWTIDHGYNFPYPRVASMQSQFFRALEAHTERLPYLHAWVDFMHNPWNPGSCPYCDNREINYVTSDIALDTIAYTDPTAHANACSWLDSAITTYNAAQYSDGSWGEHEYSLNFSYVDAPKSFAGGLQYQASPWRSNISINALEWGYDADIDTTADGCNNPTLAAATLVKITNGINWLDGYGRDSSAISAGYRGVFYEVNSQSQDQDSFGGSGTVSANVGSNVLTGVGTNFVGQGVCDGLHSVGFRNTTAVYKISSCTNNTIAALSVNYGYYGEVVNLSASASDFAPPSTTGTGKSLASFTYGPNGDRNLVRVGCGAIAWLYAKTLSSTYLNMAKECISATLGGQTAGLDINTNIGFTNLPCSGLNCDGLVTDIVASAAQCAGGVTTHCTYFGYAATNQGKNYGEAYGFPRMDNALGYILYNSGPVFQLNLGGKLKLSGKFKLQ